MRPIALLVLAACTDYTLQAPDEPVTGPEDTDAADSGDPSDTGTSDSGDPDTGVPVDESGAPVAPEPLEPIATDPLDGWSGECDPYFVAAAIVPPTEACTDLGIGGFTPVVEWTLGANKSSRATVAVGDVDGDGKPDIVANITSGLIGGRGELVVARGDGSGTLWTAQANLGYAAAPALADLDGDGHPEILAVREYASSMAATGDYTLVAYGHTGQQIWESAHYRGLDFDYASAVHVADMDHDGSSEIVVGRVIFRANGVTRGVGAHGRGSMGVTQILGMTLSEASVSAIADLDLDGVDEVVTGNARYRPDGTAIWQNNAHNDGMVAVGNLDADPFGEWVAVTGNTIRAIDTNGTLLWGPKTIASANIVSPPAIADVDADGQPDILVAGGNSLLALRKDGSTLWEATVEDMTGASGASVFDFEGDGFPEVVYIDEVAMYAFDGRDGTVKFQSSDHSSDTMYDYPVIADVDGDGHAEIVVAHANHGVAVSVYGDATDSWAPARPVWNQHAYCITNVNDDLTIPRDPVPGFEAYNTWHSGMAWGSGGALVHDVEVEILDTCEADCDDGALFVHGRVRNRSSETVPAGLPVTLSVWTGTHWDAVDARLTTVAIQPLRTGEILTFRVDAAVVAAASGLRLRVDDDGTGTGTLPECDEVNNTDTLGGPFCD